MCMLHINIAACVYSNRFTNTSYYHIHTGNFTIKQLVNGQQKTVQKANSDANSVAVQLLLWIHHTAPTCTTTNEVNKVQPMTQHELSQPGNATVIIAGTGAGQPLPLGVQ